MEELDKKEMEELHRKEMKELHNIAWKSYHAAPEIIKNDVQEFFRKMACSEKEYNLEHKVKLHEFLAFTRKEDLVKVNNTKFFEDLIFTEGDDSIGFWEIVTLYYILVSRRPFCDVCGNFVKGAFFTCGKCFHCKNASFNICISCFKVEKGLTLLEHTHEHKDQFLDNVLLLELSRKPECQCCKTIESQPSAGTSYELVSYNLNNPSSSQQAMNSQSSTSDQLVLYNPNNNLPKPGILRSIVAPLATTAAAIASTAAAIASLCSIM